MFVENLLSSKLAEFFLTVISKIPDEWQKVIQNNNESTID